MKRSTVIGNPTPGEHRDDRRPGEGEAVGPELVDPHPTSEKDLHREGEPGAEALQDEGDHGAPGEAFVLAAGVGTQPPEGRPPDAVRDRGHLPRAIGREILAPGLGQRGVAALLHQSQR